MQKKLLSYLKSFKENEGGHVLYTFEETAVSLSHAATFIEAAAKAGDPVAVIESEKNIPFLYTKLKGLLTEEEFKNVHFINNFSYYMSNGNFHPPTVEKHFARIVDHYFHEDATLHTWARVEWGDEATAFEMIADFEDKADRTVSGRKMISVCAYDKKRLSVDLINRLRPNHQYHMSDTDFTISLEYNPAKVK
ncbi:MEDS domain-containing protein [Alteribacter lacisalsi]|uniref:MEDS domain-containing protein n=1 Tax=Alteribacter lacisalsi TaxID=2045244 RepID=UPI0013750537|nr:MEDS domain-containing protein [Alteribacter lacisalsi]